MLSFSQTSGYAVLALSCLGASGSRPVLAKEISECTGVSLPYLLKLFHSLTRHGLIASKRGYCGGYTLARPAHKISLFDVVEAVEGEGWQQRCIWGLQVCRDGCRCPLHSFWQRWQRELKRELQKQTLFDVSQQKGWGKKRLKRDACLCRRTKRQSSANKIQKRR